MGFMRRKSSATTDGDEVRVRNRFTKPMTSKSPNSRKASVGKQSPKSVSHSISVSSQLSLEQMIKKTSKKESRAPSRSHLFQEQEGRGPTPPAKDLSNHTGVALLVRQFEDAASTSQNTLATSGQLSKNNSLNYGSYGFKDGLYRQPSYKAHKDGQSRLHKESVSDISSPTEPLDWIVDPLAIPKRRESTYRPGEATRRSSAATRKSNVGHKENLPPLPLREKLELDIYKPLPPVQSMDDYESIQEPWTTPPPPNRTETPTSLDFKAIGNLQLGSLHVVNGRTSPVLSDLSRVLISQRLRDVSSVYAESTYNKGRGSETWEDADVADDIDDDQLDEVIILSTPTRVTCEDVTQEMSTPMYHPETPEQHTRRSLEKSMTTPDKTSQIADTYRRELQGSPFSLGSSSPASSGSVMRHDEEKDNSTNLVNSQHQGEPDSWDTTIYEQVQHTITPTCGYNNYLDDCYDRKLSLESELISLDDKPSEVGTVSTRNQAFSSALEYQAPVFQPPPSPERTFSPEFRQRNQIERVDSGYNSGTSIVSLNTRELSSVPKQMPLHRDTTPIEITAIMQSDTAPLQASSEKRTNALPVHVKPVVPADASVDKSLENERSPRKLGRLFQFRSTMARPSTSEPIIAKMPSTVPRSAGTIPAAASSVVSLQTAPSSTLDNDHAKSPKKLQKDKPRLRSRSRSKAKDVQDIVVQRLASCGSTLDIPAIPENKRASLNLRCLELPELDRTFRSQDHTGLYQRPSTSTLVSNKQDIRFPSPYPNPDDGIRLPTDVASDRYRSGDCRFRSRSRSKSRRRSLLDYIFKSDQDIDNYDKEPHKAVSEFAIADFGDVVHSLGANPYDIAHTRRMNTEPSLRRIACPRTNPTYISTNMPAKRLSMTDEQASEYARRRSHSFSSCDDRLQRKHPLNDLVGLPNRHLGQSLVETNVPPIPPLPDKEEIKRLSLRHSLQSPQLGTPMRGRNSWVESLAMDHYRESSPAPVPPAHSPRPSFVDHHYEHDHLVEDDLNLAPPPPSHSPVPMDIQPHQRPRQYPQPRGIRASHTSRNSWDVSARAWQEKRLSAGQQLRTHRKSFDSRRERDSYNDAGIDDYDDAPIYPVIPPRHPGRVPHVTQEPGYWGYNAQDYDDHGYDQGQDYYIRRSQTWDEDTHNPYRFDHRRSQYSGSSFQNRQQRYITLDDGQAYLLENDLPNVTYRRDHGSQQANYNTHASHDSHLSFYSHTNCPVDQPFDDAQQRTNNSEENYGQHDNYYPPQTLPMRGRSDEPKDFDYSQPNGYQRQYHHPQPNNDYTEPVIQHTEKRHGIPRRPLPTRQEPPRPTSRSPNPPSAQSHHSPLPRHSPAVSRPASRHSLQSNASPVSLAQELHPEINGRPSQAPDYGRYSGGMNYAYEGRDRGFGGSAGTRSVSGKADALFKGTELRGTHGVDLGDVPFIGIMKRV